MSRPPSRRPLRLVLDTNVVVSAILWGGKPGQLLALAGITVTDYGDSYRISLVSSTPVSPCRVSQLASTAKYSGASGFPASE
jgi:hypothetical protein